MKHVILFMFLLLLFPPSVEAVTRYISPTGGGTACTIGAPCALSRIMAVTSAPNDIWILRDGIKTGGYLNALISLDCSAGSGNGTPGNPIIVMAENERGAWLKAAESGSATEGMLLNIANCNHWQFIGLVIEGTSRRAQARYGPIYTSGGSNLLFQRNIIYGVACDQPCSAAVFFQSTPNVSVIENEFIKGSSHWVSFYGSNNGLVRRNYFNVRDFFGFSPCSGPLCQGNALAFYHSQNGRAENNIAEIEINNGAGLYGIGSFGGPPVGNTFSGNIAINGETFIKGNTPDSNVPLNNKIEHHVSLRTPGVTLYPNADWGVALLMGQNSDLNNLTISGFTQNSFLVYLDGVGSGKELPADFQLTNSVMMGQTDKTGYAAYYNFNPSYFSPRTLTKMATFNNVINYVPNDASIVTPVALSSNPLTTCPFFIKSSMTQLWQQGTGTAHDGNPNHIGADIKYATVNGVVQDGTGGTTETRFWNPATKEVNSAFIGATVAGINGPSDGSSLRNFGSRYLSACDFTGVYGPPVTPPSPNLVVAMSFDNNVSDTSGRGNNGTLQGKATYAAGKYNEALSLNSATSDFVSVPHAASLIFTTGFTIEMWVKPTSALSGFVGLAIKGTVGGGYDYFLYGSSTSYCAANAPIGGLTSTVLVCYSIPLTTNWQHVAVTADGSTLVFYLDGTPITAQSYSAPIGNTGGELRIGASQYGEYFTGLIDDFRLYDGPIPADAGAACINAPSVVRDMQCSIDPVSPITPIGFKLGSAGIKIGAGGSLKVGN